MSRVGAAYQRRLKNERTNESPQASTGSRDKFRLGIRGIVRRTAENGYESDRIQGKTRIKRLHGPIR
jgi:hypothetical protein